MQIDVSTVQINVSTVQLQESTASSNQSVFVFENNSQTIPITDVDPPFTVTEALTSVGSVRITADSTALEYTPADGFSGSTVITYTVLLASGECKVMSIEVRVSKATQGALTAVEDMVDYVLNTGSVEDSVEEDGTEAEDGTEEMSYGLWRVSV